MANANISNIILTNTFDEWRTRTNDVIEDRNILRNAYYVKDHSDFEVHDGRILIYRTLPGLTFYNQHDAKIGHDLEVDNTATIHVDAYIDRNTYSGNVYVTFLSNTNTLNVRTLANIYEANIITGNVATLNVNGDYRALANIANSNTANSWTQNATDVFLTVTQRANILLGNIITSNIMTLNVNGAYNHVANIANSNTANSWTQNATDVLLTVTERANILLGNIITANIATLNVNAPGAIANIANANIANSNTINSISTTANVTSSLYVNDTGAFANIRTANIATLNVFAPGASANIANSNTANSWTSNAIITTANVTSSLYVNDTGAFANIRTANIATLNVFASGAIANIANSNTANSWTSNAIFTTANVTSTLYVNGTGATATIANATIANSSTSNAIATTANVTSTLFVNGSGASANIRTAVIDNANVTTANITTLNVASTGNTAVLPNIALDTMDTQYKILNGDARLKSLTVTGSFTKLGAEINSADAIALRNGLLVDGNGFYKVTRGSGYQITASYSTATSRLIVSGATGTPLVKDMYVYYNGGNVGKIVSQDTPISGESIGGIGKYVVSVPPASALASQTMFGNMQSDTNPWVSGTLSPFFNNNASIRFLSTANVWQAAANDASGVTGVLGYNTILTTSNVKDSVTSTETTNVAALSAVKTAYDTAVSAGNTVQITANSGTALVNKKFNLVNTATINVAADVHGSDSTIANVSLTVNVSSLTSSTGSGNLVFKGTSDTAATRGLTGYKDADGVVKTVKSAAISSFTIPGTSTTISTLVVTFPSFTPSGFSVTHNPSATLNWDQAATGFAASVTNPTDYTDEYISDIDTLTASTGTVSALSAFTNNFNNTPAGGVSWTKTLTVAGSAYIRSSTSSGATGGSFSGSLTWKKKLSASPFTESSYSGQTNTVGFNWNSVIAPTLTLTPISSEFLQTVSSTPYTLSSTTSLSLPASSTHNGHTITAAGGTVTAATGSGASLTGTFNFTTAVNWTNGASITGRVLNGATIFTRPAAISATGASYTYSVASTSGTTLSATWTFPSFHMFSTNLATAPTRTDIISGSAFVSGGTLSVTKLGQVSSVTGLKITNSGTSTKTWWFGVYSAITQPTTYEIAASLTGARSGVSLAAAVATVGLYPGTSTTLSADYKLYGINIQPGDTYIWIS